MPDSSFQFLELNCPVPCFGLGDLNELIKRHIVKRLCESGAGPEDFKYLNFFRLP